MKRRKETQFSEVDRDDDDRFWCTHFMRITDCNLEIQIHYKSATIQSKTHSKNNLNYARYLLISALIFEP